MGAVFLSLVEQHVVTPRHVRQTCTYRRVLVVNRWLVRVYDLVKDMVGVDIVFPAQFVDRWRNYANDE